MRTFCNDLARCLPGAIRINRGKLSRDGVAEKAVELKADRVIIIDRWKGGPGKVEFFFVKGGLVKAGLLLYVRGIKLQREFVEVKPKPARSLAVSTISTDDDVKGLSESLAEFLRTQLMSTDEAITKGVQTLAYISKDALGCVQLTFVTLPDRKEVGPRMTMSHVVWRLDG